MRRNSEQPLDSTRPRSRLGTWLVTDKRIWLSLLIVVGIALGFWTGSRYPALDEKAMMAGDVELEDPLGFEPLIRVHEDDPALERVAATTVNWLNTNRQGMAFGVALAAAFLTLLSLLEKKRFESGFGNTLLGVTIGAPLGVCVNCAAPIARGLHAGGTRLETTLAAMISSPTLNIVVLAMLFSLFPFYMVALKLGATLLFLLVVIPLLCRFVFDSDRRTVAPETALGAVPRSLVPLADAARDDDAPPGWGAAVPWVAKSYGQNLWFIVRTTLPWMFLAGLLGAAVITLLPWEPLTAWIGGLERGERLLGLVFLASFGLFLPVPIAFDVFICAALQAAGMPSAEVTVLLFTLGIFSVYSYVIVGQAVSWSVGGGLAAVLLVLGVATGLGADALEEWDLERRERSFVEAFARLDLDEVPSPVRRSHGEPPDVVARQAAAAGLVFRPHPASATPPGVSVESRAFSRTGEASAGFRRVEGREVGFVEHARDALVDRYVDPFSFLGGVAVGDVNDDGRDDVLIGSGQGLFLYVNLGGTRFVQQRLGLGEPARGRIGAAALVDLDDDGWLDVFFSVFRGGHWVAYSNAGEFSPERLVELSRGPESIAMAVAFADLERDGDLDAVLGNWASGFPKMLPTQAANRILRNDDGFRSEPLPGIPGETLSILVSDVDLDGDLDLLVGNDHDEPDAYYLGSTGSDLVEVRRQDGLFPHTTRTTMSIDSSDLDNDLVPELYLGQTSGAAFGNYRRGRLRSYATICADVGTEEDRRSCERSMAAHEHIKVQTWSTSGDEVLDCRKIADDAARLDCVAVKLYMWARLQRDPDHCKLFPRRWGEIRYLCGFIGGNQAGASNEWKLERLPQIARKNVLLVRSPSGAFEDRAEEFGVSWAGWTWSARFADLDNDEWQDLFAVNGYFGSQRRESNVFYRNLEGRRFSEETDSVGLTDHFTTGAAVHLDVDDDGDLDVLTVPFNLPPRLYWNELARGRALAIELRDFRGNRFGIGSRIIVHYGAGGAKHQVREIKASGGYLSYDAPVAWFGLGEHAAVERIEITWSTGERSELRGGFSAGRRYRVTRGGSALAMR